MAEPTATTAASTRGLLDGYRRRRSGLDEMLGADGNARPQWQSLCTRLEHIGLPELRRRQREIERRLREDGATYHIYGNPQGPEHPWALDTVPLLIDRPQWEQVSRGLEQRAHLLNLLLADLYGPQRALRDGLLPPAVVLGHPGYVRALVGAPLPTPQALPLYTADLARGPDERLWVLGDRVQAPSGLGYALENRRVMAETMPRLYRDMRTAGLGAFVDALERLLTQLAGSADALAMLTPGPYNETYFDQALLAAHLGIPLVLGDDLNSAGGSLRMPRGTPLRALLRRLDADWCDPLELRPDSLLGVPGMLEQVRCGQLHVVNPLGSGVLENHALTPFLPALARAWLGEELLLPQVATWWCGQPRGLAHVLANIDNLLVRPIARAHGPAIFPGTLAPAAREALLTRIRAHPEAWAAQAPAVHSTAPVITPNGLAPRAAVLRSFAVAADTGYTVMPGALVRTAARPDSPDTRGSQGGPSKDLWVPAAPDAELTPALRTRLRDRPPLIPPHTADNLYWIGRYLARAEALARAVRAWSWRVDSDQTPALRNRLLLTLGALAGMPVNLNQHPHTALLGLLAGNASAPVGLAGHWRGLDGSLGAIRDRLPGDALILSRRFNPGPVPEESEQALAELEPRLTVLWALEGVLGEALMPHDGGAFFACGLHLERTLSLIATLNGLFLSTADPLLADASAEAVLAASGGGDVYRRSHGWPPEAASVLDLLLREPDFARSLNYQLDALERSARSLPGLPIATRTDWADQVRAIAAPLAVQRIASTTAAGELIRTLRGELHTLSDALSAHYFPLNPQLRTHRTL
ncbi:circularly permuted type 2 ATP-grasp protein [Acidihalobacter ferrooxydans]|uniref:Uncharacterized protein n=1 Tax=Acidihalobacter ferrooxydans TaxID=1765967 RepID=A0A1P8UDY2_9GAMM|nr:circularly permuted type 2 ATP-grasp protein [Acidihalobacter ferrooxydans]APZ41988.1 hypothetical protein BW247_01810 [Acidihalobacter ferrooxydans]